MSLFQILGTSRHSRAKSDVGRCKSVSLWRRGVSDLGRLGARETSRRCWISWRWFGHIWQRKKSASCYLGHPSVRNSWVRYIVCSRHLILFQLHFSNEHCCFVSSRMISTECWLLQLYSLLISTACTLFGTLTENIDMLKLVCSMIFYYTCALLNYLVLLKFCKFLLRIAANMWL